MTIPKNNNEKKQSLDKRATDEKRKMQLILHISYLFHSVVKFYWA